jgi:sulfide dehydrogenase cytochrome subunit
MHKLKLIFYAGLAILVSVVLLPSMHAGELGRGALLSSSCEGCHGTNGHSPGSIPDISGKTAEYIRLAMEDFRSGKRQSTVMGRHMKGYTDEEILLIAEYFGQQK